MKTQESWQLFDKAHLWYTHEHYAAQLQHEYHMEMAASARKFVVISAFRVFALSCFRDSKIIGALRKSATRWFLEGAQNCVGEFCTSSKNSRGIRFCRRHAALLPRTLVGLDGPHIAVMMKVYPISGPRLRYPRTIVVSA
jgi:hypothetical protein